MLRPMRWTDIDALTELERQLFPSDAWSAQTWWSELAHRPRRRYAVLDSDGDITGYAGLDRAADVADVMTVAVAAGHQGNGHGRVLIDWLMAQARADGAGSIMLEVRADNRPAQSLYQRVGFEQIRIRRGYYQPGAVDALVMRAHLIEENHDEC